jgi:hypothetical protein
MFKVIITGGRRFNDYKLLKDTCDFMLKNKTEIEVISCKCFQGPDKFGEIWAKENNYRIKDFPPDWYKYNLTAVSIRNKEIVDYADALICFWDGKSKVIGDLVSYAKQKCLKIKVVLYEDKTS